MVVADATVVVDAVGRGLPTVELTVERVDLHAAVRQTVAIQATTLTPTLLTRLAMFLG